MSLIDPRLGIGDHYVKNLNNQKYPKIKKNHRDLKIQKNQNMSQTQENQNILKNKNILKYSQQFKNIQITLKIPKTLSSHVKSTTIELCCLNDFA